MQSTELILNPDGSVYHLHLLPEDLAEKIIFVGDPERVPSVAKHFDTIEVQKRKREFHTVTGIYKGQRMTVLSTGIGTDNIDIVLNELDALANIDLTSRSIKKELKQLKIMRLGTCGGLQKENLPSTIVHSRYAIGMDRLLDYYDYQQTDLDRAIATYFSHSDLKNILPYTAKSSDSFYELLQATDVKQGITVTAQGFYGPQGRSLGRIPVTYPTILDTLSAFSFADKQVLNLEMETAGILGLGALLGHECASLSVILANRPLGLFSENPARDVEKLIEKGLDWMLRW